MSVSAQRSQLVRSTQVQAKHIQVVVLTALDAKAGPGALAATVGGGARLFCVLRAGHDESADTDDQAELPGVRTASVAPNRGMPFWNQKLTVSGRSLLSLKLELWMSDLMGNETPVAIGSVSVEPAVMFGRDDVSTNLVDVSGELSIHLDLIIMSQEEDVAVVLPSAGETSKREPAPTAVTWANDVLSMHPSEEEGPSRVLNRCNSHPLLEIDMEEAEEGEGEKVGEGGGDEEVKAEEKAETRVMAPSRRTSDTAQWWNITAAQHNPYTSGNASGSDGFVQEYQPFARTARMSVDDFDHIHATSNRMHIDELLSADPKEAICMRRVTPIASAPAPSTEGARPRMDIRASIPFIPSFESFRFGKKKAAAKAALLAKEEAPQLQALPSWAVSRASCAADGPALVPTPSAPSFTPDNPYRQESVPAEGATPSK